MKTCNTCKWYNIPNEDEEHTCICPKINYGYGPPSYIGEDALDVENDEGWGMIPGPKFGCIHHKDRE